MVDWKITNLTKNKSYLITNIENLTITKDTGLSVLPIPLEDSNETLIMKYSGVVEEIGMSWKLVNSALDLSSGEGIYSVSQQRDYLLQNFVTPDLPEGSNWSVFKLEEVGGTYVIYGDVAKISINYRGEDVGNVAIVNLDFKRGVSV